MYSKLNDEALEIDSFASATFGRAPVSLVKVANYGVQSKSSIMPNQQSRFLPSALRFLLVPMVSRSITTLAERKQIRRPRTVPFFAPFVKT